MLKALAQMHVYELYVVGCLAVFACVLSSCVCGCVCVRRAGHVGVKPKRHTAVPSTSARGDPPPIAHSTQLESSKLRHETAAMPLRECASRTLRVLVSLRMGLCAAAAVQKL